MGVDAREEGLEWETEEEKELESGCLGPLLSCLWSWVPCSEESETVPSPSVLILSHPECEGHKVPRNPDQPQRVASVLAALRGAFSRDAVVKFEMAPYVPVASC